MTDDGKGGFKCPPELKATYAKIRSVLGAEEARAEIVRIVQSQENHALT